MPEQIQVVTRKRPDYVIEKLIPAAPYFLAHTFVEVKSLVNCNIGDILDQLSDTIQYTVYYNQPTFSCFSVAMKGTNISLYTYHNFIPLLN